MRNGFSEDSFYIRFTKRRKLIKLGFNSLELKGFNLNSNSNISKPSNNSKCNRNSRLKSNNNNSNNNLHKRV